MNLFYCTTISSYLIGYCSLFTEFSSLHVCGGKEHMIHDVNLLTTRSDLMFLYVLSRLIIPLKSSMNR